MRLFLFSLLMMAPAVAFAQMSPTPPETRPNPVFSMPIETMEPSPLPPLGETLPSLLGSSIPGAPPMMIMQPPQQPAPTPESQPSSTASSSAAASVINDAMTAIFGDMAPSTPQIPGPAAAGKIEGEAPAALPTEGATRAPVIAMPEFVGIDQWINSNPLTKESLKGKVVLVDFWTYSCVNCVRTLPYLKEWYKKYKDRGLVIIGVHSPEFDFEKDLNNVKTAVQKFGITYPVALDNRMATWAAYQNNVWPAHYFIDAKGNIRHIHLGEGDYDKSEQMIQKLLMEAAEAARKTPESQPAPETQATAPETKATKTKPKPESRPVEKPIPPLPELSKIAPIVDFSQIKSPETYLGLLRRERLVTSGRPIEINEWMYDGKWRTEGDRIVLAEGTGKIYFRFNATKVYLVMTPTAGGVQAVVKIDGVPVPQPQAGADVKNGTVMITEPRMYELINLGTQGSEHIIEIEFLNPGAAAYAFTFG